MTPNEKRVMEHCNWLHPRVKNWRTEFDPKLAIAALDYLDGKKEAGKGFNYRDFMDYVDAAKKAMF